MGRRPPLHGVRVLDLTTAWAGPMATRCLAFLGADVIRVENPNRIDSWRGVVRGGDPTSYPECDPGVRPYNRTYRFNAVNTDKRSIALDLRRPQGRMIALRLALRCDVVVANFSDGVLDRLGLGYAQLAPLRPDIIVVEMPAYGSGGPLTSFLGMGNTMEAMAGMTVLMGYGDGVPRMTGTFYLDPMGALHATAAVLTALAHRRHTGRGQHVEVAQREAAMHWAGELLLEHIENGETFQPDGNTVPDAAPHDAYACLGEDEWVAIAVFGDGQWRTLCDVIGRPDLASDPRFASFPERWRNRELLREPLTRWTGQMHKARAASLLQACGVPAAPVYHGRDIAHSPYLQERGFFATLEHPEAGTHPYAGLGFRLRDTPGGMRAAAPCFGQHNEEVLVGLLGLDPEQVAELERAGVLASAPEEDA